MAGTKAGARKAVKTKLARYGKDVFKDSGKRGGKARSASDKRYTPFEDPEYASRMGKLGSQRRWG